MLPPVCANCGEACGRRTNAAQTFLVRPGPDGVNNLCNACGVEYRRRGVDGLRARLSRRTVLLDLETMLPHPGLADLAEAALSESVDAEEPQAVCALQPGGGAQQHGATRKRSKRCARMGCSLPPLPAEGAREARQLVVSPGAAPLAHEPRAAPILGKRGRDDAPPPPRGLPAHKSLSRKETLPAGGHGVRKPKPPQQQLLHAHPPASAVRERAQPRPPHAAPKSPMPTRLEVLSAPSGGDRRAGPGRTDGGANARGGDVRLVGNVKAPYPDGALENGSFPGKFARTRPHSCPTRNAY
jgi:hypothetical protein